MTDTNLVRLEFFFRSSNPSHQAILLRVRSALEASQDHPELTEFDLDTRAYESPPGVPALPCLRRIEPPPVRTLIANLGDPEEILRVLGLKGRSAATPPRTGGKFFVYADDDDNTLLLVRTALKRLGGEHLLVHCSDGQELLSFLDRACRQGDQPRFVLLDIRMPKISGIEALQRIKNHPLLSSLPVVVFSSGCTEQEEQIARALGAVDCRQKPGSFAALCRELQENLVRFDLQPF